MYQIARLSGEALDLVGWRGLPGGKHLDLEAWPVEPACHVHRCDRLDDVVDVGRPASGVRPQADVGLLGREKLIDDARALVQQRALRCRLVRRQRSDLGDVTARLEQQRPDAERANAVFDPPTVGVKDRTTREWSPARGQVTGEAAVNVHPSNVSNRSATARGPQRRYPYVAFGAVARSLPLPSQAAKLRQPRRVPTCARRLGLAARPARTLVSALPRSPPVGDRGRRTSSARRTRLAG